jgi:hypothetical protein
LFLLISASVSSVLSAGRKLRHPLAAGKRAMLVCSLFSVERNPAAAVVQPRLRKIGAASVQC